MSRNTLAPSPRVIRPAASTTVTSPTWRCDILTLTNLEPPRDSFGSYLTGLGQVLHHPHFRPARLHRKNLEFVHESADQKQPTAGLAEQITFGQWIRYRIRIEAVTFVGNNNRQPIGRLGHRKVDLFARVVAVPVNHSVYHAFPNGHSQLVQIVFFKADL